ncbi:ComF family protein [Candidatus Peregrinibacteria bacterium]|nr:MAG: ComF family protein [Candidatus Peregrinibacteria bacterium]
MIHGLLKLFFPSLCLVCGYLDEPLCARCRDLLPFEPHVRVVETPQAALKVAAACYYEPDSVLAQLVHGLKYKHQADVYRYFAPALRRSLELFWEPSQVILVPVPLHKSRLLERGYNQAELLARTVARYFACGVADGLERVKDTGHQAHLEKRDRLENMKEVFRVRKGFEKIFAESSQILLVDDIVTTGSTLLACRAALEASGAKSIAALTLADRALQTSSRN